MPYLINVEDDEKPSIQIENEVITIKKLTVYEIKNYVVSDNITAQDKLSVTVIVMDKNKIPSFLWAMNSKRNILVSILFIFIAQMKPVIRVMRVLC